MLIAFLRAESKVSNNFGAGQSLLALSWKMCSCHLGGHWNLGNSKSERRRWRHVVGCLRFPTNFVYSIKLKLKAERLITFRNWMKRVREKELSRLNGAQCPSYYLERQEWKGAECWIKVGWIGEKVLGGGGDEMISLKLMYSRTHSHCWESLPGISIMDEWGAREGKVWCENSLVRRKEVCWWKSNWVLSCSSCLSRVLESEERASISQFRLPIRIYTRISVFCALCNNLFRYDIRLPIPCPPCP